MLKTPKITDEKKTHFLQGFVIIEVSIQSSIILYRTSLNKYIMFTIKLGRLVDVVELRKM